MYRHSRSSLSRWQALTATPAESSGGRQYTADGSGVGRNDEENLIIRLGDQRHANEEPLPALQSTATAAATRTAVPA